MKVVTFKIDEELLQELDLWAQIEGVSRSELIREAVKRYLRDKWKRMNPQPKIVRLTS